MMENTINPLEISIAKAKEKLSPETREAINSVNWKQIILGINVKFNSTQLEILENETELLLCGLVSAKNFPKELGDRLQITKNEVDLLINNLDQLIFKKIQKNLEEILKKSPQPINKPFISDPRFVYAPKEVQEAIAKSDWEKNLREITAKYKLSIDKMDPLEKTTIKVIVGSIKPDEYESRLKQEIGLSQEDTHNLVLDIDNNILKVIKEKLKGSWGNKNEDIVPLPPYSSKPTISYMGTSSVETKSVWEKEKVSDSVLQKEPILEKKPEIKDGKTLISDIYRESGIEIKPTIKNDKVVASDVYRESGIEINPVTKTKEGSIAEAYKEIPVETKPVNKNTTSDMYRELGVEIKPTEKDDKVVVSDIYRESGIEIIDSASEENKTTEQKENPTVPMPSISMLKDKFENTTKSLNVVNNYSLPKINNTSNSVGTMPTVPTNTTPHDPYHEEI